MPASKRFDVASLLTITVTLVLFVVAVFVKGIGHDSLLEAAVFIVSVKLILMSYKNQKVAEHLDARLERIERLLAARPPVEPGHMR